ncbi:adenosine-diphosphatase, putative [Plasmodium gallinaceum]|uniref:Adenosine-diphosphatase, putative n=1 Tax=Plasmodium gallinaceum TaxID=5849 RepID=A0A1J1GQX5_PLAGA|nr:adenosine-diphosphatase, putative [Plasmodium gallinaceum]CRG94942.1 adenosine-diphosphatase, putative [Plasmodium gallinaceum]
MKNDGITKNKSLKILVLFYVIIIYLNLKINCDTLNKQNKIEKNNLDIYKSVIIDAGSTGTRIHIYNYKIENNNEDIKIFIPSISHKASPGLVYMLNNYFSGDEINFYDYFKKIKDFIYENVEKEERSNTVILFRASGGFRLLSISKSEKYINFLKDYLYNNFNEFLLIDELLIKVLSGKEEAILSFISIYSLLEKSIHSPIIFSNDNKNSGSEKHNVDLSNDINDNKEINVINDDNNKYENNNNDSIGVIEIGGASAQIVIKIPLSKMNDDILNLFNYKHKDNKKNSIIEENYKNKNIVKIKLFRKNIFLYCKSYLVLGRQNAMKTYLHYVVHKNKKNKKLNKFIPIPCFPKNFKFYISNLFKTSIEENIDEYDEKKILKKNEYIGIGTGDLNLCRKEIQIILNYSEIDNLPFRLKKFIKLYAIENFHHFATDILNISENFNPLLINTNMYLKKAEELCPLTVEEIRKLVNPNANIEKAQTSCFGLVFLYEFLRHIFKIDNAISFYSTNYINNTMITWTIAVLLMEIPPYLDLIKKKKKINYDNDEL